MDLTQNELEVLWFIADKGTLENPLPDTETINTLLDASDMPYTVMLQTIWGLIQKAVLVDFNHHFEVDTQLIQFRPDTLSQTLEAMGHEQVQRDYAFYHALGDAYSIDDNLSLLSLEEYH